MTYINNDVYQIVNAINKQANGLSPISVVDTKSFVDYGNNILTSNDSTETFMSTLLLRLARTYYTYRPYTSSLKDLLVSGEEYAAIYQKIDVEAPEFVSDETYNLEDGKSVDQYVVRKPKASQKLFIRRSPYSNYVTVSRKMLQGAFKSEEEFAAFVRVLFGKMRIKLDFTLENLARLAIANYIGTVKAMSKEGSLQIRHLATEYEQATGKMADGIYDKDYQAFAVGQIQLAANWLTGLSTQYNLEGAERHTPESEQKLLILDTFQTALQSTVQYQAFHDDYVKLKSFVKVPYWQGEKVRDAISVTVQSSEDDADGTNVMVDNIIGVLFDRYALGTFRSDEETLTTPVNARARYYNTFHFAEQLWYNDLSENFVLFLND